MAFSQETSAKSLSDFGGSETLSNQLLTLLPESLGGFGIECVGANAFADNAQLPVLRHDLADVAVLAITSANLLSRGNKASPDRGGCSLRNSLVLKRPLALGS